MRRVIPTAVVHWAVAVLVILALGLVALALWRTEQVSSQRAAETRELVCDVARLNGAFVAYYEAIIERPVASGIQAEIELLLIESRGIAPHLNAACEGRPIPPVRGGP